MDSSNFIQIYVERIISFIPLLGQPLEKGIQLGEHLYQDIKWRRNGNRITKFFADTF